MAASRVNTYRIIAKAWSAIFLLVALLFLFAPQWLGQSLTGLGRAIGLSGVIHAPANTPWHVLTLSLMGTLAVLAAVSARFPEKRSYYLIIVIAKGISVAGFLKLALASGTVWLLCAGADAFVALSLAWAFPKSTGRRVSGFAAHSRSLRPFYEVWFGKIDIAPQRALWFRYTTLNGQRHEASTWAILFHNGNITTGKNTWPLAQLAPPNSIILPDGAHPERFQDRPQVFHLGHHHLDTGNAIGSADSVSWDLQFTSQGQRFEFVPPALKALGLAKTNYYDCFMNLRFSGQVKVGGETIPLENRPGMIGHISGKKSGHAWAWVHCNQFAGGENALFEGLSGQIELGGKPSRPLTSLVLIVDGRQYAFAGLKQLVKTHSRFGNGQWEFEAHSAQATLKGTATAPDNVALVEYIDTDDSRLWCRNSKLANLSLELTDQKTGQTHAFEARGTAAFEIVNREEPSGEIHLK